jgi:hypothetical protein
MVTTNIIKISSVIQSVHIYFEKKIKYPRPFLYTNPNEIDCNNLEKIVILYIYFISNYQSIKQNDIR